MVRAMMMSLEQIVELALLAHADAALWSELKDRELAIEKRYADAARQGREVNDPDVVLDPPKLPTMATMVSDLVKRRYGPDENFDHGVLLLTLRRRAREELGLSV